MKTLDIFSAVFGIVSNNKIGVINILAGSGAPGNADGVGANASFTSPDALAIDGDILYVGDVGTVIK